jgi:DNA-binding NarL/FixJ family response regulator
VERQQSGPDGPGNRPPGRPGLVLIVDDHPIMRHGLRELLSHEMDLAVCGEAEDSSAALRLIESLKPDVVLVDISLKDGNGIDLIKRIRAQYPALRTLVASMHDEHLYAERALEAGALGYVSKQEPVERVVEALRAVLRGEIFLSPEASTRLLRRLTSRRNPKAESPIALLSDRELEVFEAVGRGRSTRAIALELNVSIKTVETYRENIKQKLSLTSNTELIQRSFRWVTEER